MVTALFRLGRIRTTKAKARELRRTAERLITRAGIDSVHNRRMAARTIQDRAILAKLFTQIGGTYVDRPGGYTRILKLGPRYGDAAEMVILELVKNAEEDSPSKGKARRSRKGGDASATRTVTAEAKPTASPLRSVRAKPDVQQTQSLAEVLPAAEVVDPVGTGQEAAAPDGPMAETTSPDTGETSGSKDSDGNDSETKSTS